MFDFILGNKYLAIAKWIAIAAAVWYIFHTWDKAQGYDDVKKQLDASVAEHNAYVKKRGEQDKVTTQVSTDYENAVTDLVGQLNAARTVHPDIRLCHNALPSISPASATASKPDEASKDGPTAAPEQVAGPNISDGLYEIASEAAECGERLNHLQDWITQQLAVSTAR